MAELSPDDADGLLDLADRCSRAAKTARQVTAPAWSDPIVSDRIRALYGYLEGAARCAEVLAADAVQEAPDA